MVKCGLTFCSGMSSFSRLAGTKLTQGKRKPKLKIELEILTITNHLRETVMYVSCAIQSYIHNIKHCNHEEILSLFQPEAQREVSDTFS